MPKLSKGDTNLPVRRFLRDHYGSTSYALLTGPVTITNIPADRLPFLIATILLHHAGGLDKAFEIVMEAHYRMQEIEHGRRSETGGADQGRPER